MRCRADRWRAVAYSGFKDRVAAWRLRTPWFGWGCISHLLQSSICAKRALPHCCCHCSGSLSPGYLISNSYFTCVQAAQAFDVVGQLVRDLTPKKPTAATKTRQQQQRNAWSDDESDDDDDDSGASGSEDDSGGGSDYDGRGQKGKRVAGKGKAAAEAEAWKAAAAAKQKQKEKEQKERKEKEQKEKERKEKQQKDKERRAAVKQEKEMQQKPLPKQRQPPKQKQQQQQPESEEDSDSDEGGEQEQMGAAAPASLAPAAAVARPEPPPGAAATPRGRAALRSLASDANKPGVHQVAAAAAGGKKGAAEAAGKPGGGAAVVQRQPAKVGHWSVADCCGWQLKEAVVCIWQLAFKLLNGPTSSAAPTSPGICRLTQCATTCPSAGQRWCARQGGRCGG